MIKRLNILLNDEIKKETKSFFATPPIILDACLIFDDEITYKGATARFARRKSN